MSPMAESLIVNEIYRTLQGEGTRAGLPCVIVRLTGCNLRCKWCDSTYAYDEGRLMTLAEVLAELERLATELVMITGGEPLLQPAAATLVAALCEREHTVLVETNGSRNLVRADPRVIYCVDVKCPGSGEAGSFLASNVERLHLSDEVKFVLTDRGDYDYAAAFITEHRLPEKAKVILLPAAGLLSPAELAGWMLADEHLPGRARLGVQLHKILWPEADRGV